MVINKIISLCKAQKNIMLYKTGGVQWIGDGGAIYPLYGVPELCEESAYLIFDIPEEKRAKFRFNEQDGLPSFISDADEVAGEIALTPLGIRLRWQGRELLPLEGEDLILFVDGKYLEPFRDLPNGVQLYARRTAGGVPYIAVKDGMFLSGIIQAFGAESRALGELLRDLGEWVYDHSPRDDEE